jgi:hypothetical protein
VLLCVFLQLNLRLPFFRLPASISCNCVMHFTQLIFAIAGEKGIFVSISWKVEGVSSGSS